MGDAADNMASARTNPGNAVTPVDANTNTASAGVDDGQLAALKKSVADVELKASAISRGGQTDTPGGWWSTHNAMTMCGAVLLFGAVVIALAALRVKQASNEEALRLYGTIMVITMAVFLVVAGYDDKQIAAPLGLLGTIVGYLLGRGAKVDDTK